MTALLSRPRRNGGFTLIELMVALAVAAILMAVAWPSFQEAIRKSRRADGMGALSALMQAQERFRTNNPTYQADLSVLPGATGQSTEGYYTLSLVDGSVSATGYTARATIRSGSRQVGDNRCQVLQVTMAAGNIRYTSLTSGGSANAAPDPCWVR